MAGESGNPVNIKVEPNSHKYKKEKEMQQKKLEPVVNRKDLIRPDEGIGSKFKKMFVKKDLNEISEYAIKDIFIPGAKKMALNMLHMAFFGKPLDDRYYNDYDSRRRSEYYDYRGSYDRRDYSRSRYDYSRPSSRDRAMDRDKVDYKRIIVHTQEEAEKIVDELRDRIREQGTASVANLLELVGVIDDFEDNSWGWDREGDIGIKVISTRSGRGFLIDVPAARYIGGH